MMKTLLTGLVSALILVGCGGGGGGTSSTTPGSGSGSTPAKVASHWEVTTLDLGMTSTRVKTKRSVALYNDGNQVADYTLLYNLPPDLSGKGCSSVQPGAACSVVFNWTPTTATVMSANVYPTRDMTQGTQMNVQGTVAPDTTTALVPFWTVAPLIQWEGEAPFTLNNNHTVIVTRIAFSNAGQVANSQCEAIFQGSVASDLNGQVLAVKDARFTLTNGQTFTQNSQTFTRYQSTGDATACNLAKLSAGSYIVNI